MDYLVDCFSIDSMQSHKGVKGHSHEAYYGALSKKLLEIYEWYKCQSIEFSLTQSQLDEFNRNFKRELKEACQSFGIESVSVITRFGVIAFRIMMILSALRFFNTKITDGTIECTNMDFQIAMVMSKTLMHHSMLVFKEVRGNGLKKDTQQREKFYSMLPNEVFKKDQADAIGKQLEIPERTISYILNGWIESHRLIQPKYAFYQKT